MVIGQRVTVSHKFFKPSNKLFRGTVCHHTYHPPCCNHGYTTAASMAGVLGECPGRPQDAMGYVPGLQHAPRAELPSVLVRSSGWT